MLDAPSGESTRPVTTQADDRFHDGGRTRVPALDSVRAVAIAFVLCRHAWPNLFGAAGFAGVEVFFVLSGFLITSILVSDERAGLMSYRRFYINRVLRLYPALIAVLICVGIVVIVADPVHDRNGLGIGLFTAATYISDVPSWTEHVLPELGHLWTLAVEEQFYLLWPILLITFMRRGRLVRFVRAAFGGTLILMLATVAFGVAAYGSHGASDGAVQIYSWPTTWALTLVAGALLAIGSVRPSQSKRSGYLAVGALLGLCFIPGATDHIFGYLLVLPAVAVFAAMLIANAAGATPMGFLLDPRVRYLGKISYGVYLWNYPLTLWISGAAAIPLSVAAASLSFYLIERPFLKLRRRPKARPAADLNHVSVMPQAVG